MAKSNKGGKTKHSRRSVDGKPARGTPAAEAESARPVAEAISGGVDLNDPAFYINRELSQLEFNSRVLQLAQDPSTPLLERLRFLVICSTNLDEFFEIRIAGLRQQAQYRSHSSEPDGLAPQEALRKISEATHELVRDQYRTLQQEILPALRREGIYLLRRGEWSEQQRAWLRDYFEDHVMPVLTPIALDPSHPFPRIVNKALNFAVQLSGPDAFGRTGRVAVVPVPRTLPRIIRLPADVSDGKPWAFVRVSSIVREFMDDLFPGMEVSGAWQFRVTRNSDLWVDEEEVDDLLSAIKGELSNRSFGEAVRLVVAAHCPEQMAKYMLEEFGLAPRDLYRVDGPVNLHRLTAIYDMVDRPDLKYPVFVPAIPEGCNPSGGDIFSRLRDGDLLIHQPYESFSPVIDMARQAALDPDVVSIKLTLYRTGQNSPFTEALIEAAKAGKDVTAVIELRARFDEAANIDLATRLQEHGATVAYGIVGYKCHAKMMLVVRREGDGLRRYVHLGTGNYHAGTAKAYTDLSYMTCDREVCRDVHRLFIQLTGMGEAAGLRALLQSPFTLESTVLSMIDGEIAAALEGRPCGIMARMNAITERRVIQALYRASQAGVPIQLLVRGACALRPGVPGVSDNIRVISVLGRFLEHTRVYAFVADGKNMVYGSSADWMTRNLTRRVETAFPIPDGPLKQRVLDETLNTYFRDTSTAWELQPNGSYTRIPPAGAPFVAQEELLRRFGG